MLMNILHIRPPYLSEPLYLKKPKRVIIRVLFIHTADYFSLSQKRIPTVVLQLQLFTYCSSVLPIICIALITATGARYGRSACIEYWDAIDQWRKRLEARWSL